MMDAEHAVRATLTLYKFYKQLTATPRMVRTILLNY